MSIHYPQQGEGLVDATKHPPFEKIVVHEFEEFLGPRSCDWCGGDGWYSVARTCTFTGHRYESAACARCANEWWNAAEDVLGEPPPQKARRLHEEFLRSVPGRSERKVATPRTFAPRGLTDGLAVAVALCISEYRARGGPKEDDLRRAQEYAVDVGAEGDVLLYGGKKGKPTELFAKIADGLAVLTFAPGGVDFAGMHFETGEDDGS